MDKVRKVHYSNNVQKIRTSQLWLLLSIIVVVSHVVIVIISQWSSAWIKFSSYHYVYLSICLSVCLSIFWSLACSVSVCLCLYVILCLYGNRHRRDSQPRRADGQGNIPGRVRQEDRPVENPNGGEYLLESGVRRNTSSGKRTVSWLLVGVRAGKNLRFLKMGFDSPGWSASGLETAEGPSLFWFNDCVSEDTV